MLPPKLYVIAFSSFSVILGFTWLYHSNPCYHLPLAFSSVCDTLCLSLIKALVMTLSPTHII